jgi:hypothetical protein
VAVNHVAFARLSVCLSKIILIILKTYYIRRYAWSIASAIAPGGPLKYVMRPEFMLQPPWDSELVASNGKKAAIIHYTYANDFDAEGNFTPAQIGAWHFDKRDYMVGNSISACDQMDTWLQCIQLC